MRLRERASNSPRCAFQRPVSPGSEVNFDSPRSTFAPANAGGVQLHPPPTEHALLFSACQYFCCQSGINTRGFCAGCGRPGDATTWPRARFAARCRCCYLQDPASGSRDHTDATNVPALPLLERTDASPPRGQHRAVRPRKSTRRDAPPRHEAVHYAGSTGVTGDGPHDLHRRTLSPRRILTGASSVNRRDDARWSAMILSDRRRRRTLPDRQSDAVARTSFLERRHGRRQGSSRSRVHVISFAGGGNRANTRTQIAAAAGGTTASCFAPTRLQLSAGALLDHRVDTSPRPATTGPTTAADCGRGASRTAIREQTCCAMGSTGAAPRVPQRPTRSRSRREPDGRQDRSPCTRPCSDPNQTDRLAPLRPRESCDNVDNNCQEQHRRQGVLKLRQPAVRPPDRATASTTTTTTASSTNDLPAAALPTAEVCDGCDNDCDGLDGRGIASVPCGIADPANCAGALVYPQKAERAVHPAVPARQGGFGTCTNNPQTEVCGGIDNNCDGIIDNASCRRRATCPRAPRNLRHGPPASASGDDGGLQLGTSASVRRALHRVCDGIDNDRDGRRRRSAFGVGPARN